MNKKIIAIVCILLVLGVLVGYGREAKEVHYHAGFVVFDNGVKQDFSDLKYMDVNPCMLDDSHAETKTAEEIQNEKAHLHDGVGDVMHSHVAGAVWGDLFTNIDYPLDYSKVTAYINGQKVENLKDYPITGYDSLTVFVGSVDEKLLNEAVSVDRIKEVESKSENCGT